MIYFVRCEQDTEQVKAGWIKCGTTTRMAYRLREIGNEIGHPPTLMAIISGTHAEEKSIHRRFAKLRVHREWFRPEPELTGFIEAEGRPWDGSEESPLLKSVKLPMDVIETARLVSKYRGESITNMLSNMLRPVLLERMKR